jgi:hypothetical protein
MTRNLLFLSAVVELHRYHGLEQLREVLGALIASKLEGTTTKETPTQRPVPVVNILAALQRSLDSMTRKQSVPESTGNTRQEDIPPEVRH